MLMMVILPFKGTIQQVIMYPTWQRIQQTTIQLFLYDLIALLPDKDRVPMDECINETWNNAELESTLSTKHPLSHFHKSKRFNLNQNKIMYDKMTKWSYPPIRQISRSLRCFESPRTYLASTTSIKERSEVYELNTLLIQKASMMIEKKNCVIINWKIHEEKDAINKIQKQQSRPHETVRVISQLVSFILYKDQFMTSS